MKTVFKKCIECEHHSAIHWNRNLCGDCLGKLLSQKVKGEEDGSDRIDQRVAKSLVQQ